MQRAIFRLLVLVTLLTNQVLITVGWSPLPFSEEEIYEGLSSAALVATAIWMWWKNNNITKEAQEAQVFLNELKRRK